MRVRFKSADKFNMDLYFDPSTALEEHVNKGYKLVAVSCPLVSFTTRSNGSFLLLSTHNAPDKFGHAYGSQSCYPTPLT